MTCDEIRESLSAYLDEALAPEERARVDAHLGTCAECRQELAGLRGTVALLQRVQPARAPVGFADRVVAAARPRPWYRRALDALFLPLPMKLPLEVTAAVMVGLLAVYLFERTPELRQAARQEALRPEAPAPAAAPPRPAGRLVDQTARPAVPAPAPAPAPTTAPSVGERARRDVAQDVRPPTGVASPPPAASAPAAPVPAPEAKSEAARGGAPAGAVGAASEAESRPRPLERSAESARAAPSSPGLMAKRAIPSADVVARVAVKDRDAAERELAALIARVGGSVVQRRGEEGATVVEALIPQPRYAEFSESLARLGSWQIETERPDLPAQVRVILRLQ
jgi:anti-sigma factor RsiW